MRMASQILAGVPGVADHRSVLVVDGPSGSGKTALLRGLAARYSVVTVELGVLVRAVAWWAEDQRITTLDAAAHFSALQDRGLLGFRAEAVGEPAASLVTIADRPMENLFSARWANATQATATDQAAMRLIQTIIRDRPAGAAAAVSGRTAGLAVFPDAGLRVRLQAPPRARAARKRAQLGPGSGWEDDLYLIPSNATGYLEIDTSEMSADAVVALVGSVAERRLGWVRALQHSFATPIAVSPLASPPARAVPDCGLRAAARAARLRDRWAWDLTVPGL